MKRKVFIIAEAGVNHNGDIRIAKELIDVAVEAKADAVKFQTWKTELLVSKDAEQAEYQSENTGKTESQYEMLKRLELSYDEFYELKAYCDKKGILFLSTPDETESADFLNNIQDVFKIGSGELTNVPFLRHIARFKKRIILSTGMGIIEEVRKAVSVILDEGIEKDKLTLLHATTQYPTKFEEVNLKAMLSLQKEFGIAVGYSDHTMGKEISIAAVGMGASVIEKHFTLSRSMDGPDHSASMEPAELKDMIQSIRNVEVALGNGEKQPSSNEKKIMAVVRKSIIATKNINKGDVFSEDNLGVKRTNGGISADKWDELIGTKATKDYKSEELIK